MVSKRNVVHVELPAENVQGASQFYQDLFGWKMEHAAEFDYTMWEDGSGYGGGFNKVSEETPAGQVIVYIHSDDIEADLKKVEDLGGTVVTPHTPIPGVGASARVADTEGNIIGLYESQR